MYHKQGFAQWHFIHLEPIHLFVHIQKHALTRIEEIRSQEDGGFVFDTASNQLFTYGIRLFLPQAIVTKYSIHWEGESNEAFFSSSPLTLLYKIKLYVIGPRLN